MTSSEFRLIILHTYYYNLNEWILLYWLDCYYYILRHRLKGSFMNSIDLAFMCVTYTSELLIE